jgi:hypothetical protein
MAVNMTGLHIDLFNFEDEKFEGCKYILTSPRSLEACSHLAIKPIELLPKRISDFKTEYIPRGLPIRTICSLYREHERERLNKLHLCIEERQRIIGEDQWKADGQLTAINARAAPASAVRDQTEDGFASLGDKSGDDGDDAADSDATGDRGSVERARTAWTTSLGHRRVTSDELNNRALELLAVGEKLTSQPRSRKKRSHGGVRQCSNSARSNSLRRRGSRSRRCLSDLGYASRDSQETLADSDVASDIASASLSSHRRHVSQTKGLFRDVRPVTDPLLLKSALGASVTSRTKLRAKDEKILSLMAAKRLEDQRHELLSKSVHKLWDAERSQQMQVSLAAEDRRRKNLVHHRRKQQQQQVEMTMRLQQLDDEKRREREQQVERTLRASEAASHKQELTRMQKRVELQKEQEDRRRELERRLEQQSLDDATYRDELLQYRREKLQRANVSKAAAERELVTKTRQRNRSSQEKHEVKLTAIRRQSIDDRIHLRNSIDMKLHQTDSQFREQQRRRHLEIHRRQQELDRKIELSKLKQLQMEDELSVWRDNLLSYRKAQAEQVERVARETAARKSQTAHTLRSQKEKLHRENIKKLAERERQWKNEMEASLEQKQARIAALQDERDRMILESRALAGASQKLRQQIKTNYSMNDLDQLSRQADLENRLLFKPQHYVSRYNPLNASSITLG